MGRRSLQASTQGIAVLKKALKRKRGGQTYVAGAVGCSRQTIWSLLQGSPIDCDVFMSVCQELELNWESIAVPENAEPESNAAIDVLVETVRKEVHDDIQTRCGSMRVLDMRQPIGLDAIYTTVNIFEKVIGRRRQAIADLLQGCNVEELTSLGKVKEKRVPGLEAVERHSKLLILGKPGAGKTTFLKWIAIQCNNGQSRASVVPAFVTLKAFAEAKGQPDLLAYLSNQWADCRVKDTQTAETLLSAGRVLLLLDGLDEVRDSDHDRVLQEIRDFSTRFRTCQFVMTCRIAAQEYTFEQFTEVEVADFDNEQIADFVNKWFTAKQDPIKIKRFLNKLRGNARIKELATNPLLLTLLCWVFQEAAEFPTNRSELYREGLDVLLKKWDAKRNIERDALSQRSEIYQSLSLQRKEALLSQIAFTTFERGNIFFKQQAVEHYIAEFIRNLRGISDDPKSLELDSEAILKLIEAQHGLLVERARGIYSFSHLTFQEYFTARYIEKRNELLPNLVEHTTEKHWEEVFLLTVGMLEPADTLVQLMKAQIDQLVAKEEKLQQFLHWAHEKASSVKMSYKPSGMRAFYAMVALDLVLALDIAFDLVLALDIAFDIPDFDLDSDLVLASSRSNASNLDTALKATSDPELKQALQTLKDQLPDPKGDQEASKQWWQGHGHNWFEQLRSVTIQHRNVGHNWQFSQDQVALLVQYYAANKLLVDCLNSDCYVTRSVREEIEATLLLPQSLLPDTQKERQKH